jgi:DNA-binding phage protein
MKLTRADIPRVARAIRQAPHGVRCKMMDEVAGELGISRGQLYRVMQQR